jgi:hypothetical protein
MNLASGFSAPVGAVEASYKVAYQIAKQGKPYTIGESLIMPCAKLMVSSLIGDKEAKKLDSIPISNNTIQRRIEEMADDIKMTMIKQVSWRFLR